MVTTPRTKPDNVAKAVAAWGDALPAWIQVLAEACSTSTQAAVAKRLGYSSTVVSLVLSNNYKNGDLARIEKMVRGVLMAETVECPRLGGIALNDCLEWQGKPYFPTSSHRVEMYRACRSGCPHSRAGSQPDPSSTDV